MMGIWTIPAGIAAVIMIVVGYYSTVGVMKMTARRAATTEMDTPISKTVREHPVLFNPIIIMYIIFGLFTGIMILYYWSQYRY